MLSTMKTAQLKPGNVWRLRGDSLIKRTEMVQWYRRQGSANQHTAQEAPRSGRVSLGRVSLGRVARPAVSVEVAPGAKRLPS